MLPWVLTHVDYLYTYYVERLLGYNNYIFNSSSVAVYYSTDTTEVVIECRENDYSWQCDLDCMFELISQMSWLITNTAKPVIDYLDRIFCSSFLFIYSVTFQNGIVA